MKQVIIAIVGVCLILFLVGWGVYEDVKPSERNWRKCMIIKIYDLPDNNTVQIESPTEVGLDDIPNKEYISEQ